MIGFLSVLVLSCNISNPDQQIPKKYFDVTSFIKAEIVRLDSLDPVVHKTTLYDQKQLQATYENVDWDKELSAFIKLDINKPSWEDGFIVDTFGTDIIYIAADEDITVRKLSIGFDSTMSKVMQIQGELRQDNLFYYSQQLLTYEADKNYTLTGNQKILWMKEKDFEIRATFPSPSSTL